MTEIPDSLSLSLSVSVSPPFSVSVCMCAWVLCMCVRGCLSIAVCLPLSLSPSVAFSILDCVYFSACLFVYFCRCACLSICLCCPPAQVFARPGNPPPLFFAVSCSISLCRIMLTHPNNHTNSANKGEEQLRRGSQRKRQAPWYQN